MIGSDQGCLCFKHDILNICLKHSFKRMFKRSVFKTYYVLNIVSNLLCLKHKDVLKISYELSYTRTTLSCTRTVVPVVRDAVIRDNRINYII